MIRESCRSSFDETISQSIISFKVGVFEFRHGAPTNDSILAAYLVSVPAAEFATNETNSGTNTTKLETRINASPSLE